MSRGILNSINSKDKHYKKNVKRSPNSPNFDNLKLILILTKTSLDGVQ